MPMILLAIFMVSISGHVRFYIMKYEWHGTRIVLFPALTN